LEWKNDGVMDDNTSDDDNVLNRRTTQDKTQNIKTLQNT